MTGATKRLGQHNYQINKTITATNRWDEKHDLRFRRQEQEGVISISDLPAETTKSLQGMCASSARIKVTSKQQRKKQTKLDRPTLRLGRAGKRAPSHIDDLPTHLSIHKDRNKLS